MAKNQKAAPKAAPKVAPLVTPAKPAASAGAVANALQTAPSAPTGVASALAGYKVARVLTIPFVLITSGVEMVLRVTSKMVQQEGAKFNVPKRDKAAAGLGSQDPWVCDVTNVQTGALGRLICNKIIQSTFEMYPDGDYVGRVFAIRNSGKREGKNYMDMQIVELEAVGEGE